MHVQYVWQGLSALGVVGAACVVVVQGKVVDTRRQWIPLGSKSLKELLAVGIGIVQHPYKFRGQQLTRHCVPSLLCLSPTYFACRCRFSTRPRLEDTSTHPSFSSALPLHANATLTNQPCGS